jgi:hypothetical protein
VSKHWLASLHRFWQQIIAGQELVARCSPVLLDRADDGARGPDERGNAGD